jgi:hypothetical protein
MIIVIFYNYYALQNFVLFLHFKKYLLIFLLPLLIFIYICISIYT